MTVEPMIKDINIELLKQMDRERISLNQNLFYSQEINQQKHYSINQLDSQQQIQYTEQQNPNQFDQDRIILSKQSLGESVIIPQVQDNYKAIQIDQPELSMIFEDLKYKLSYDYLIDESDFNLYLFEDSIRIMQNRNDCYNFRIFLPIIDATPNGIIMSLFDTKTQTKWNKQIKNIEQLENLGLTTIKIKETRLPYGYFYQPRTFTYVRQFYSTYNEIFVIEKSDDKGSCNINWNICAVFLTHNILSQQSFSFQFKIINENRFRIKSLKFQSVLLNYQLLIQKQQMVGILHKNKTYNQLFNIQKNICIQFNMLWN